MITAQRLEQTEKVEHISGLLHVIEQILVGPQKTSFSMAGHRLVRPNERFSEPLTDTDGDETVMENHGEVDAGEPAQSDQKSNQ